MTETLLFTEPEVGQLPWPEGKAWLARQGDYAFEYWQPENAVAWRGQFWALRRLPPAGSAQDCSPDQPGQRMVGYRPNWHLFGHADTTWDQMIESGRNYMVGREVPISEYVKANSSRLIGWFRLAYHWAKAYSLYTLAIETARRDWEISAENDWVVIKLPYHDKGGEYTWISRDGIHKVLIDVD